MKMVYRGALALPWALALLAGAVRADEGMWTFDGFPSDRVAAAYGFAPDQAWLDHLRLASGRLSSGCSAGIVSAEGLIQTNHHCMLDCIQQNTPPGGDPLTTPVVAATREDERLCPGLTFEVLTAVSDVTADLAKATAGLSGEAYADAFETEKTRIEKACRGDVVERVCEVSPLFQGGQQKLHQYRTYADVRLVLGVEGNVGSFGGDPDNFDFPRFALDVGFLRAYENGKPAATPTFLKWRSTPVAEGELLFVAGSPYDTSRLWTVSRIKLLHETAAPFWMNVWSELRGRLFMFTAQGPEEKRIAAAAFYDVENWFKSWRGEYDALSGTAPMARLEAAEAELKARIAADPQLAAEVGDAWERLAAVDEVGRANFLRYQLLEEGIWGRSVLFDHARTLVRAADEGGRDAGGQWPDTPLVVGEAFLQEARVEPRLEELMLGFWFSKVREYLTADDPVVRAMLGRESPEGLAARLVAGSKLGDAAERRRLTEGGARAVMESDDPMIAFVRGFDADARALRDRWQTEVASVRERLYAPIARARFRLDGDSVYPDANRTPRISYGAARGWTDPSRGVVPYSTNFAGLYGRATGAEPYRLAPLWEAARDRLDPDTIFNISTTNDTVGGNSGSPVVDREGAVVGAMFDGNLPSFGGFYFYDAEVNRSVVVASTAVEEALVKVYRLQRIVDEMKR